MHDMLICKKFEQFGGKLFKIATRQERENLVTKQINALNKKFNNSDGYCTTCKRLKSSSFADFRPKYLPVVEQQNNDVVEKFFGYTVPSR